MSISRQNLSVIIVSFKSDKVIHDCIRSIDSEIEIIVVDNSNNKDFKETIEKKYENVRCILSEQNIGMGAGNNLGIKNTNKDFALILNPDVTLEINAFEEIIKASNTIDNFGLMAPISSNLEYPNYKADNPDTINPFKVKSIDGYAMLLNLKKLRQIKDFNFFDENFFLYLENDDLCLRIKKKKQNIYIIKNALISHKGGISQNRELEYLRNWHWMWSKFYFNKKHYGAINALKKIIFNLLSANLKYLTYLLIFNKHKTKIYKMRILGLINSILGKKSSYRLKD